MRLVDYTTTREARVVPRWLPLRSGVASAWVLMSTHVSSDGGPAQGDTTAAAGQVPAAGAGPPSSLLTPHSLAGLVKAVGGVGAGP